MQAAPHTTITAASPLHPHQQCVGAGPCDEGFLDICILWHAVPEQSCSQLHGRVQPLTTQLHADILTAQPGLLIIVHWSLACQAMGNTHMIPTPQVSRHPADLVQAYRKLLFASPTTSPDQPLLTVTTLTSQIMITARILSKALHIMSRPLTWTLLSIHFTSSDAVVLPPHTGAA